MDNLEIVDSHFHVYDLELRKTFPNKNVSFVFPDKETQSVLYKTVTLGDAEAQMATCKVKNGIFVQVYDDCPEEARWVHETSQKFPFVKAIVAGLDLTKHEKLEECINEFKAWKKPKLVGVRHLVGLYDKDFMGREDVRKGLGILERHGLTFDIHGYPWNLGYVTKIAQEFPNLKLVIDHLAKPNIQAGEIDGWKKDIEAAASHPNVYVKLSGLIIEADPWSVEVFQPYVNFCLEKFGLKRCMFGSDWPVCRLAKDVDYKEVVDLLKGLLKDKSESELRDVFRDNAARFYGIEHLI